MEDFKTPGVYVREVPTFPPSVAQVETAIPAFVGYTETITYEGGTLQNKPVRITSLSEYQQIFGNAYPVPIGALTLDAQGKITAGLNDLNTLLRFRMFQSLQLYFANGGGACYIVAVNNYLSAPNTPRPVSSAELIAGINALTTEDEPTLLVIPDAVGVTDAAQYHAILTAALQQCADLKDRFLIADMQTAGQTTLAAVVSTFRDNIGTNNLTYGAVYHPYLRTILNVDYDEAVITINQAGSDVNGFKLSELKAGKVVGGKTLTNTTLYEAIKKEISKQTVILPPSSAIAGVYASVDRTRGVWKAPANVSLNFVRELVTKIDDQTQQGLNVHPTGKSVNALRFFEGKGNLVWGARTLAGNDYEWRYISVRRFFIMVEESVKKATEPFVFEPNDANTWVKVKGLIENFLFLQWRAGALAGKKPEQAFYVHIGLGQTMTALDILEGRMIVEIGMAAVRPAEFIILRFSHKMQES
ncbi:hypothetical protein GCM10023187_13610 [Nibrella viscosa]|uniref:Tail sheath protein C-terminal domain-containing protein n=1 Tax=Nibrella viscosa TaxID=1084524 RepID=A0ABP8K4K6_9BACT